MTVESLMAFATPSAIIVATVLQQRALTRADNDRKKVKKELEESSSKSNEKLNTIHTLVNSEMSKALQKIDDLTNQIINLKLERAKRVRKRK